MAQIRAKKTRNETIIQVKTKYIVTKNYKCILKNEKNLKQH